MYLNILRKAVKKGFIEWQRHAVERMLERGISRETVRDALLKGELIEDYPDNKPYHSALILGWDNALPIHVVVALDILTGWCFIITVYIPDLKHFKSDYKTRRQ